MSDFKVFLCEPFSWIVSLQFHWACFRSSFFSRVCSPQTLALLTYFFKFSATLFAGCFVETGVSWLKIWWYFFCQSLKTVPFHYSIWVLPDSPFCRTRTLLRLALQYRATLVSFALAGRFVFLTQNIPKFVVLRQLRSVWLENKFSFKWELIMSAPLGG